MIRAALKRYWSLILIGLALSLLGWAVLSSKPFQQCVSSQQQANGTANHTNISSIPISLGIYRDCVGRFVIQENAAITALATLMIAIFTIVLAEVSNRQARLTKETLITDKRAFVCADFLYWVWERNQAAGEYNFRLRARWRNTGGTPTKNLRSHVECEIRNTPLPKGHVFIPQDDFVGTGLIPAHGEGNSGIAPQAFALTPTDIIEAQVFRRFIYFWGWAKYHDVFSNTPEHTTHFCWLILVLGDPLTFVPNTPGQPPTPGTLNWTFLQHTEGNYAD